MTRKQKDWLQVNAIVAFIFSMLCIIAGIQLFINPGMLNDILKNLPAQANTSSSYIMKGFIVFFSFCVVLFVHIIWTRLLVKRNKEYFDA